MNGIFVIMLLFFGIGMLSALSRPRYDYYRDDTDRDVVVDDIDVGGGCDCD